MRSDVLETEIKELINTAIGFFDNIEKSCGGEGKLSITKQAFMDDIIIYGLYISVADDVLDFYEYELINAVTGKHHYKANLEMIIEKRQLYDVTSADKTISAIKMLAKDFGNDEANKTAASWIKAVYRIYSILGSYLLLVDEKISVSEYERIVGVLSKISELYTDVFKKKLDDPGITLCTDLQDLSSVLITHRAKDTLKRLIRKVSNTEEKDKKEKNNAKTIVDDEKNEVVEEENLEQLLEQLNLMIGLNEVKADVISLMNLMCVKRMRELNGLQTPPVSMHLVFSGNPGTGKTTVARLLSKIYKCIGVLSKGHLVEVDRAGLVAEYVGQTSAKVKEVIEDALGGVLFIDEAYALSNTGSGNDYGREVIDILVKSMEDNRDNLVVIVAGYPELMEEFIDFNPGLKSRFNKYIYFRDYTPLELREIFIKFCHESDYRPSFPLLDYIYEYFIDKCANKVKNFANAREVRNIFEKAISNQASRIVNIDKPSSRVLSLLKLEDLVISESEDNHADIPEEISRYGIREYYLDKDIDGLELPDRILKTLYSNNIHTISDYLDRIESEMDADISNMNERMVAEVNRKLAKIGFKKNKE